MSDVYITLRPRTFWGKRYYPAADADTQISMLREQLAILWQENENLRQQCESAAAAPALDPALEDEIKGLKQENENLRSSIAELQEQQANAQPQISTDQADLLHQQLVQLIQQNETLRQRCQAAESAAESAAKAETAIQALEQENAELRHKLAASETKLGSKHLSTADANDLLEEKAERDAARIKRLMQTIDSLKLEIAQYEKVTSNNIVEEASVKADRILSRAMQESERIMSEAVKQRDSVIAASRSAYYNAVQFKMNLATCMSNTERDLDDAIETLRLLKHPTDSMDSAMMIAMSNEPED